MSDQWTLNVGDLVLGTLTASSEQDGWTVCDFTEAAAFDRFRAAFGEDELWDGDNDELDTVVDEIAVDGVWLVSLDGTELVDPTVYIADNVARFRSAL